MLLSDLVEVLDGDVLSRVGGDPDVQDVTHDSRRAGPGTLFCCVPGGEVDGHAFAPQAVDAGAVALLVERSLPLEVVAQVQVPSTRVAMAPVAARCYGDPSQRLDVVGVTGTNGKTTVVHLLGSILRAGGRTPGEIGTLTGARTTPEAPELQAQLADFLAAGCDTIAMEVSSHALAAHRVDATRFEVAAFTNLSRDHLDHHQTMEAYFEAKALLFTPDRAEHAVVDVDGPWGAQLADRIEAGALVPLVRVSLGEVPDLEVGLARSRFTWRGHVVEVPLGGRHNAANALLAAEAAALLDLEPAAIARGLATATPVRGRFEAVDVGQPFTVLVDYAHTPDGLEKVLGAVREGAGPARVSVVFGCGGDRDATKRPEMGRVAAAGADRVVVTSDNPRSEPPGAIIDAVLAGIDGRSSTTVEPDRRAAIALALREAQPGDVVVIAGKGHETTQEVAGVRTPFDDRAVAEELLGEDREAHR